MSEGAAGKLFYGFERAMGVPGSWGKFLQFDSETFLPDRTLEQNPNIDPSRSRLKGRQAKVTPDGKLSKAPDTESDARLRLAHRRYVETVELVPGVYEHTLRPYVKGVDTPLTTRVDSLFLEVERDDDKPVLMLGNVINDYTLKVQQNKYLMADYGMLSLRETILGDPETDGVQTGTYTNPVFVRGFARSGADILLDVTTAGALDGTAKMKATFDGIPYGTVEIPIVAGRWIGLRVADGWYAGTGRTENVEVYFVPQAGGVTLAVGDGYSIAAGRTMATPVYSTRDPLHGAQALAVIDGTEYILHDVTIKGTTPYRHNYGIGATYPQNIEANGRETWDVDVTRDYDSREFLDRVISGEVGEIYVTAYGDRIGSTIYEELHEFHFAAVQFEKAGSSVNTENTLQEKITTRAFYNGTDPQCVERIINTIPDLLVA